MRGAFGLSVTMARISLSRSGPIGAARPKQSAPSTNSSLAPTAIKDCEKGTVVISGFYGDLLTNTINEHEYPHLAQLIGGWFHQDFDIEGGTLEAMIAAFKKVTTPADCAETRADIGRLLSRYDDQALSQEFVRL